MKIKTALTALTILLSSSTAFASAPVPFNIRVGHDVIYIDWKISALPSDSVKISTPDGVYLGGLSALPENENTRQITLPLDKNISTVMVDYNGIVHSVALPNGMDNGSNR
ncbi:hypothetical protein [Aeromonas enteropelogenes]|uniref:hypothetical protein n=1 Tax=Aeromonas enteropelogenes TaxID=29489 RepID=UPI003B9FB152